jgi:murein DD-endopeptidase MepM/ murein hydrolase activator NlpD
VQQNYRFLGNRGDQPEKLSVDQSGLDPAINDPENKLVQTMVSPANPVRSWNGIFTVPGYNRDWLTSRFGNRRIYNSDPKIYFHTGLDFEGGSGLPIKAAAPGTVIFAGPLTVRGNATFIDHGWGVYTAYYHQSEIQVSVGDKVAAGQQIGLVGATGLRLTGAHLHWEVWVNGVQVDPIDWLDIQYP